MKSLFMLLSSMLLLFGCQAPTSSPLGVAGDYFPATELLRKGVVNKYYFHFTSANGYEKSTDINYHCYRLLPDDRLEITVFDAGFMPRLRNVTRFEGGRQIVEEQARYWRNDTLPVSLQATVVHEWAGPTDTAHLETVTEFSNDIQEHFSFRQNSRLNTAYENQPAIVFYVDREREYTYSDREPRRDTALLRDTYRHGIGLFERELESSSGKGLLELVAQMPRKKFMKQRAAAPKRVAYINPANTLDDAGENFPVCHSNARIYDYYNSRPPAQYRGGKRALVTVFTRQLRPELTQDISGYLTYRFVINCEGQAGRFVTEEADLDFKRTEFPDPLVQHIFAILRELDDWQPAVLNDEPIDAYAYITLKFRDGELLDILP